jgi:hypothetical protein
MNAAEDLQPSEEMLARAGEVRRAHQGELLRRANVVGVGIGIRRRQGKSTGEVALVVLVRRKLPRDMLAPEDRVPAEIDGVPVDVQEVGEIAAG